METDPLPGATLDLAAPNLMELRAEFDSLLLADSPRLSRYKEYRTETEEVRHINLDQDVGDLDYGRRSRSKTRRRTRIPIPLAQANTVKHAYRISGRLPDAIVDRRAETPEERYRSDTMERIWWGITRECSGEAEFASAAWDSSKLGSAVFECGLNFKTMIPWYRSIDPAGILVVPGVDDPHEFHRAYRFWNVPTLSLRAQYRGLSFRGSSIDTTAIQSTNHTGNTDYTLVVECRDRDRCVRFTAGEHPVGLYERVDNYGFVPFVVIPNIGPQRDLWGWADYEFVRSLARYIPILFGREADVLKAASGGAYLEKRTGQSTSVIEEVIANGGILQGGRDSSLEPIAPPEMPDFADNHRAAALEMFKMVGFSPDAAWGDGNAGSGSDRGLQLQPQLELTGLKQQNWGPGLSRLGSMLFRIIEQKQTGQVRYAGVHTRGSRNSPFNIMLVAGGDSQTIPNPGFDANAAASDPSYSVEQQITAPRDPSELFDGDHSVRFVWHNRINPDDPAYITSWLNVFAAAGCSLRTFLEKTGFENPEDEMRLIEQEADRFPWLRQGLIQMIRDQLAQTAQGAGGGAPAQQDLAGAAAMQNTKDGQALDASSMIAALPGGTGIPSGG